MSFFAAMIFAEMVEDLLRILVPIVFVVIWIVGQLVNQAGKRAKPGPQAPQKPPAPRPKVPQQGQPAGQGPQVPQGPQDQRAEVEEFLKRVAQRRGGGPPPQVEVLPPKPRPKPRPRRPVEAVVVAEEAREPLANRHRVAESVAQHVESHKFGKLREPLSDIDQADEQMAAHIDQVFDHQVGRLEHREPGVVGAKSSQVELSGAQQGKTRQAVAPVGFAAMLSNTGNLRQAIILNEILRRPEPQWGSDGGASARRDR